MGNSYLFEGGLLKGRIPLAQFNERLTANLVDLFTAIVVSQFILGMFPDWRYLLVVRELPRYWHWPGFLYIKYLMYFPLIYTLITYLVLRFLGTLIWRVSFGQKLAGLESDYKSFLWGRMMGGVRVLLELLSLFLFFLPDLPLLMGRASLKEVLSLSRIQKSYKNALIVLPFFATFALISLTVPFLSSYQKNIFMGIKQGGAAFVRQIPDPHHFNSFKTYESNHLSLSAFTDLGTMTLIPNLKKNKQGKIERELLFYDPALKKLGAISISGQRSLGRVIEMMAYGNPHFSSSYPNLYEFYIHQRPQSKVDLESGVIPKKLHPHSVKEILSWFGQPVLALKQIFPLNLLEYWPYLYGQLYLEGVFFQSTRGPLSYEMISLGKSDFLSVCDLDACYLTSLNHQYQKTFKVSGDKQVIEKIIYTFLGNARWFFDYNDVFKLPEKSENITVLTILDFLPRSDLFLEEQKKLENFAYHYLFELAKMSYINQDEKLTTLIYRLIQGYIEIAKDMRYDRKDFENMTFHENMTLLMQALKNGDHQFFTGR